MPIDKNVFKIMRDTLNKRLALRYVRGEYDMKYSNDIKKHLHAIWAIIIMLSVIVLFSGCWGF